MARNLVSKSATKKNASRTKTTPYGDEIAAYIEECRSIVAKARRREIAIDEALTHLAGSELKLSDRSAEPVEDELDARAEELRQVETELAKREIRIIEREIHCYAQQEELERLRPLAGLHRVVKAMAKERHVDEMLQVICAETALMLRCDRCSVFVLDYERSELWTQVALGLGKHRRIRLPLKSTSVVAVSARSKEIINIADAYEDPRFERNVDKVTGYRTRSILCVPMYDRHGEVMGAFEVLNKADAERFDEDDTEWLQGLAAIASGLIEQAQAYSEIESFMIKTLETLAQTIDKRDPLTAGHSVRVTRYSVLLGEQLAISQAESEVVRYAAMMHDFGKIGVPEAILWKNGRLTPEEYAIIQTHAKITYDLLSNLPFTKRLADVPFVASCHHEKLDGTGYYRNLKGDEIPFLTRIITVADVFDALTSVRHYRNRMPITKVADIIESGRNNHFDNSVVDAFWRISTDEIVSTMESERGLQAIVNSQDFRNVPWKRMVELCSGASPEKHELGLAEKFNVFYNAGLPADYQPLD